MHASGWISKNEVLCKLDLKGIINVTQNLHRVATLLAKLNISEKEQQFIYKAVNQNVYQATPCSIQLQTTNRLLHNIHGKACSEKFSDKWLKVLMKRRR